jgi:hypothetical protein
MFLSLTLAAVMLLATVADASLRRVARRHSVFSVYGGYATPFGKYDKLGSAYFTNESGQQVQIDADAFLDDTYFMGVEFGRLVAGQFLGRVGFRYTDMKLKDGGIYTFGSSVSIPAFAINYNQYDFTLDLDYMIGDISHQPIAPYIGGGFWGGWTSLSSDQATLALDDDEFTIGLNANFGCDIRLARLEHGGFVTLSSTNSINLLASDDRPRYLNLGVGLKYYFRP